MKTTITELSIFLISLFLASCLPQMENAGSTETAHPTDTPTPTSTPIPTATLTAIPGPGITALRTAYCYGGPGEAYPEIMTLRKGQQAEVVGRDDAGDYWIIKNPDGAGGCWIESQAVTTEGETGYTPYLIPPPTPTLALPAPPGNPVANVQCERGYTRGVKWKITVTLSWEDEAQDELGYVVYKDWQDETVLPPDSTEHIYWFTTETDARGEIIFSIFTFNDVGTSRTPEILVEYACP